MKDPIPLRVKLNNTCGVVEKKKKKKKKIIMYKCTAIEEGIRILCDQQMCLFLPKHDGCLGIRFSQHDYARMVMSLQCSDYSVHHFCCDCNSARSCSFRRFLAGGRIVCHLEILLSYSVY